MEQNLTCLGLKVADKLQDKFICGHSHFSKLPHTSSIFEGPILIRAHLILMLDRQLLMQSKHRAPLQLRTCLQSLVIKIIVNLPSELLTRSNYSGNNWCFNWCYEFQPLPALQLSQLWIEPTAPHHAQVASWALHRKSCCKPCSNSQMKWPRCP